MLLSSAIAAALFATTALALTPAGHTPDGKPIYIAPSGSRVQQVNANMLVFAPNGSLIHTFENVIPKGARSKRAPSIINPRQDLSATQAYALLNTTTDNLIQSFNTTFVVPPAPTTFKSQIIFLSANIQVLDPTTGIPFGNLRAALQYGGSWVQGGSFWTFAIQLEIPPAGFLQVTLIGADPTLQVGQNIISTIVHDPELDSEEPGVFWYIAGFPNVPNSTTLEVGWQIPPSIVALELEEEGVLQSSDYPAGSFVFDQINLNLTNNTPPISWKTSVDPTTNVDIQVDVDGAENGKVSIIFPTD
ncbi:hypothetical protein MIND_01059800 [Mycena indigotica]|uniref:Uncharacterized protein n=1 Tax=Mycena indigotica TaxID=2126181 RepID=A0A8H6SC99_9AGAR|nr:uncharacterized protein MIND_01059800 [Mycena indigotica]KAF7295210.1 hypothetical protein MIND_01059800 [Mycena indigotica]